MKNTDTANIKNKKYVYFHDTSDDTCNAMWNKNNNNNNNSKKKKKGKGVYDYLTRTSL